MWFVLAPSCVLAASPTFMKYGEIPLNDPSHSTPAFANGRLYLRTFHRLTCVQGKSEIGVGAVP
jgi:outer membrane protein assembly factor BamB